MSRRWLGAVGGLLPTLVALPLTAQTPDSSFAWRVAAPRDVVLTGKPSDRRLGEVSGAAVSAVNSGVIWTITDSGNPPDLFAIDTSGALVANYRLTGAVNLDWEAIAIGPCGEDRCIYIADTGDNGERRSEVSIHRLREPVITADRQPEIGEVETQRLRYPDGPHDVEAMGVRPDGTVLLVTKGRSGGVSMFTLPSDAWNHPGPAVVDGPVRLPIPANGGTGALVTDLAIRPDGSRMVVRTYRDLYLFTAGPTGWLPLVRCGILGREPQGEGVAWLPDGRLVLLSERGLFAAGTIHLARCDG